jgi:cold shock CspA family protein
VVLVVSLVAARSLVGACPRPAGTSPVAAGLVATMTKGTTMEGSTVALKPTLTGARQTAKAPPPEAARSLGRVQRIYVERGFGFIRCIEGAAEDIGQDFFFHYTGLDVPIEQLEEGSTVSFQPTYVAKGKRAEQIQHEEA